MTEWRYLAPGGRRLHALNDAWARTAACGVGVWSAEEWYGTGNQSEYERAATLPKCLTCLERDRI